MALLLPLLMIVGCGNEQQSLDYTSSEIVPSALLAPHLAASRQSLEGPDSGDSEVRRDLKRFVFLQQGLYDSNQREAAVDSFYALWEACPNHVLWPALEIKNRRFLGDGSRTVAILTQPSQHWTHP